MAKDVQQSGSDRRRQRLWKGLLVGGAAVGLPALANTLIARRTRHLAEARWGRPERYAWEHGEISFQRLSTKGPKSDIAAEPVVLLHSFGPGHDAEEWRDVSERLAKRRDVFAIDLLGWGRSEKPKRAYDGETYLGLLSDFLDDVVGTPASLIGAGHSGAYAVQVGVDQPEKVVAVGAVGPTGLGIEGHDPDIKDALMHRVLRMPIVGTSTMNLLTSRTALAQHLRRETGIAPERIDAARVEHHYRSSHQPGAHIALSAFLSGYLNHRIDGALPRLTCPLWLAWGRHAHQPAVTSADLWLQQAPHAVLEVFERSAALPHQEEAHEFTDRLEAFLRSVPERQAGLPV